MAWFITVSLFASICAAAMGMAWVLGLRSRLWLLVCSMVAGVVSGALIGWLGSAALASAATMGSVIHGAALGSAVRAGVWAFLRQWVASGPDR